MRIDYQRITDEMYSSREEREPHSRKMLIIGIVLIVLLPVATALFFGYLLLSAALELRGF